jgi:hypothetical protein
MKLLIAATFLASIVAGSSFANAIPLASAGQNAGTDVIKVAGGCGPGFHRGPHGRCFPNAVVAPVVRRCPPGLMWRYGRCRPI